MVARWWCGWVMATVLVACSSSRRDDGAGGSHALSGNGGALNLGGRDDSAGRAGGAGQPGRGGTAGKAGAGAVAGASRAGAANGSGAVSGTSAGGGATAGSSAGNAAAGAPPNSGGSQEGGAAGELGSAGDASSAGAPGSLEPYAACDVNLGTEHNPGCSAGGVCEEGHCSYACAVDPNDGLGGISGPGDDCPEPLSGSALRRCAFGQCGLTCPDGAVCPHGMYCLDPHYPFCVYSQ